MSSGKKREETSFSQVAVVPGGVAERIKEEESKNKGLTAGKDRPVAAKEQSEREEASAVEGDEELEQERSGAAKNVAEEGAEDATAAADAGALKEQKPPVSVFTRSGPAGGDETEVALKDIGPECIEGILAAAKKQGASQGGKKSKRRRSKRRRSSKRGGRRSSKRRRRTRRGGKRSSSKRRGGKRRTRRGGKRRTRRGGKRRRSRRRR